MPSTFVPNPLLVKELEASVDMEKAMLETAEPIAEKARSIAPVDTGAYQASIRAVSGEEDGKVQARVISDVDYAAFLEFGTTTNPAFATLRRASEGA